MHEAHRHRWDVASRHHTSEGMVVYYRCHCGQHRITQLAFDAAPRHIR
ncbi:MAG: hypothetical protein M3237_17025 [Actinomycetota bacterium]|nr:hypothetical protein [Actinomycetota bacterium]